MKHLFFLFMLPVFSYAQNLVPNWSFELYSECPTNFNQVEFATGWKKSSQNNNGTHHTDYMNVCGGNTGASYFTVPTNVWGYQAAATGNAYMGLSTTALNLYADYRENIFCQLLQPMIVGAAYSVSMKVCKSERTKNAVDRIGIKFSTDSSFAINNYSHLAADSLITDTSQWTTLTTSFVADSAYQYLAVGNFFIDDSTNIVNVCPSCPQIPSLYLIDDICVHKGNLADCNFTVSTQPGKDVDDISLDAYQVNNGRDLLVLVNVRRGGAFSFSLWNLLGQSSYSTSRYYSAGSFEFVIPAEYLTYSIGVLNVTGENSKVTKKIVINSASR